MLPLHHSRTTLFYYKLEILGCSRKMVGAARFELATPWSQTRCASQAALCPEPSDAFTSRGQSITANAYLDKPLSGRYTSTRCESSANGLLAQLAEQLTLNQRVVGSSPTRPTKEKAVSPKRVFMRLGLTLLSISARKFGNKLISPNCNQLSFE